MEPRNSAHLYSRRKSQRSLCPRNWKESMSRTETSTSPKAETEDCQWCTGSQDSWKITGWGRVQRNVRGGTRKKFYYLIVVCVYVHVYGMVVAAEFECVWVCYLVLIPGSHMFAQIRCELPLYTKWVLNVGILLPRLLDSWNNELWSVFLFLKTLKKSAGVTMSGEG